MKLEKLNVFLIVLSYNIEEGGQREMYSQDSCTNTQMETVSVRLLA